MSGFWRIWAVLHLFPFPVKLSSDKAFRDKAFQVDMPHTDRRTPPPPKSQQMSNQLKSAFESLTQTALVWEL